MKKSVTFKILAVLTALMMPVLAACGDDGADDPNLGLYKATTAEMAGFTMDADEAFDGGFTIELTKKGKGTITVGDEDDSFKWKLDGKKFSGEGGGVDVEGTLKGGVMILEDVMGTGMRLTLICEDIAGSNAAAADKEEKVEDNDKDEPAKEEEKTDSSETSGSREDAFMKSVAGSAGKQAESGETKAEIPMELMARYEGDWHGIAYYLNATGSFAELDGKKSDIAARFSLDENGNVTPCIISAKKVMTGDMNFYDLTAELDPDFDGMYFSGKVLGDGKIDTAFIGEEKGLLHAYFTVYGDDGSSMDIEFAMRRPDDPWQDGDYPMYPKEGFEYYKGCSLEQVIATFDNEHAELPEQTNITGWK